MISTISSNRIRIFARNIFLVCQKMNIHCTLRPPMTVKGIKELDKSLFTKVIQIPCANVPSSSIRDLIKKQEFRNWTIERMNRIKPVMESETSDQKTILFNPDKFNDETKVTIMNFLKEILHKETEFGVKMFTLTYEDWDLKRCLDAVFDDKIKVSSFTLIGHIAHLNIRDEAMPYKYVLAQILIDKLPAIKTVVNKLDKINNNFRFFEMELLAGEPNYITEVKEHGLIYKLDFSKVFWNSRLSHEHDRIVKNLDQSCVVFDVFSGIGPFALPAARKGAKKIFTNDLNPNSVEYLKENIKLNKIRNEKIDVYNMDGAKFIKEVVGEELAKYINENEFVNELNFHVLMNLPGLAVTFLPSFKGFLHGKIAKQPSALNFIVHCYTFIKATEEKTMSWFEEQAASNVRSSLSLPDLKLDEIHHVRTVSNYKEMFCLTFKLPLDYLNIKNETKSTKRQAGEQLVYDDEKIMKLE